MQQMPSAQATSLSEVNDQSVTIPASHAEPVAKPAAEELKPVEQPLELRLPMPRRTFPNQGTLVPPSPGEVPSARAVNFLPVAE